MQLFFSCALVSYLVSSFRRWPRPLSFPMRLGVHTMVVQEIHVVKTLHISPRYRTNHTTSGEDERTPLKTDADADANAALLNDLDVSFQRAPLLARLQNVSVSLLEKRQIALSLLDRDTDPSPYLTSWTAGGLFREWNADIC